MVSLLPSWDRHSVGKGRGQQTESQPFHLYNGSDGEGGLPKAICQIFAVGVNECVVIAPLAWDWHGSCPRVMSLPALLLGSKGTWEGQHPSHPNQSLLGRCPFPHIPEPPITPPLSAQWGTDSGALILKRKCHSGRHMLRGLSGKGAHFWNACE